MYVMHSDYFLPLPLFTPRCSPRCLLPKLFPKFVISHLFCDPLSSATCAWVTTGLEVAIGTCRLTITGDELKTMNSSHRISQ